MKNRSPDRVYTTLSAPPAFPRVSVAPSSVALSFCNSSKRPSTRLLLGSHRQCCFSWADSPVSLPSPLPSGFWSDVRSARREALAGWLPGHHPSRLLPSTLTLHLDALRSGAERGDKAQARLAGWRGGSHAPTGSRCSHLNTQWKSERCPTALAAPTPPSPSQTPFSSGKGPHSCLYFPRHHSPLHTRQRNCDPPATLKWAQRGVQVTCTSSHPMALLYPCLLRRMTGLTALLFFLPF